MDLYGNKIVSYSISKAQILHRQEKCRSSFLKGCRKEQSYFPLRPRRQYQMKKYQQLLKQHGIIQSMSQKRICLNNSVIESFFGRLKVEMFYGEKFDTTYEFIRCIAEYMHYYNYGRISLKLKEMSIVQYRTHSQAF